jgi:hypothetical protein
VILGSLVFGILALPIVAGVARSASGESGSPLDVANEPIPVACRIGAFSPEEQQRHSALMEQLAPIMKSPRELENGYAFPFEEEAAQFLTVAEWITLERKCCPFLEFHLDWGPQTDTPELRLTGGPGVKEFIAAQFAAANE